MTKYLNFLLGIYIGVLNVESKAQAPNISYNPNQFTLALGVPIQPIIPTNTGGMVMGIGYRVSDFAATSNTFRFTIGLAMDKQGNIYCPDNDGRQIIQISPSGVILPVAGSGVNGYLDGPASSAQFSNIKGITVDSSGNIYLCDINRIRKISIFGIVSTIAGNSAPGLQNGIGSAALFNNPNGIAVDKFQNLFVADFGNNRIRKISPSGTVSTLAGNNSTFNSVDGTGIAASFNGPSGITIDSSGILYVSELNGHKIRRINLNAQVTTIAGGNSSVGTPGYVDGLGIQARFNNPASLFVNDSGYIFISDQSNHRIRRISPNGIVTTISGNGTAGLTNGPAHIAQFNFPSGIVADQSGTIYASNQDIIRKITPISTGGYSISPALPNGLALNSINGKIEGTPNFLSPPTDYYIVGTNQFGSSLAIVNIEVSQSTSVNENSFKNFQCFPNPANQLVNIRVELDKADHIRVDITDLSGRVVRSIYEGQRNPGLFSLEVNIADLAQGLYLLRISGQNNQRTGRLHIQH